MNSTKILFSLALALLVALGAWFVTPTEAGAGTPGWQTVLAAAPNFLQQQAGGSTWGSSTGGGTSKNHLPRSVLPHNERQCSVDTSDAQPARCSVFPNQTARCSANCDADNFCSATSSSTAGSASAECSVLGRRKGICSVMPSPNALQAGASFCSATNANPNHKTQCSVLAPEAKQFCSAINPNNSTFDNRCSAFGGHATAVCSVLGSGQGRPNFCSVAFPGRKECSVHTGGNTSCSIAMGQTGICSNFRGAPNGSCSAHGSAGFCSVLGGSAGTFCRQP